jgi:hypothetical protein
VTILSKSHTIASVSALVLACGCGDTLDDLATPGGGGDGATFTAIYTSDEFGKCASCHAPGAPARTADTEATQNWSTKASAYSSLQGKASGLIGNSAACNGVPFLGSTAGKSLLVASLDGDVRRAYDNPTFPNCNADTISDQTLKIGGLSSQVLQDLEDWVDSGAPNN